MRSPPSRRRSSLVPPPTAKAGTYRARPISFAPNVTPDSFDAPASDNDSDGVDMDSPALFPPSTQPSSSAKRRQKKRDPDHVPRPPNAFMLFRADFVRQKHVPGSIETNHGSLSKIIGTLWRTLPPSEKKHWEQRAKHEKHLHAKRYPNYKYRPVHHRTTTATTARRDRKQETPQEEERCEEIAQLLLDGNKGKDLADKVAMMDRKRNVTPLMCAPDRGRGSMGMVGISEWRRRRSSSVPPELTLPQLHLPRRPSSASGMSSSSFMDPPPYLPKVDTSLFNPSFLHSDPFSQPQHSQYGYETTSPFECPPPSFYTNSSAPSPAPSSDGGSLPLYAPQPVAPSHLLDNNGMEHFFTPSQRMSISEHSLTWNELSDDQRLALRQSFSWAHGPEFTFDNDPYGPGPLGYDGSQDLYWPNYTELDLGGRRVSISKVDIASLLDSMGQDMPLGLKLSTAEHSKNAVGNGGGCVDPGELHQKFASEDVQSPSCMSVVSEAY